MVKDNCFGTFLKDLRGGNSLRKSAKDIGISHTYLNSLESGCDPRSKKEITPTVEVLRKLSSHYKVPFTDLIIKSKYLSENDLSVIFEENKTKGEM